MKTTTLCLVVSVSVAVLVLAVLYQKPVETKTKEGFDVNIQDVSIGAAIGAGIILVIFGGFFLFYYLYPKQPNVIVPRRGYFLNNQY